MTSEMRGHEMGCCGKRRQQISAVTNSRVNASNAVQFRASSPVLVGAKVHYLGSTPIQLKGSYSGGTYFFSPDQPEQFVDRRDIDSVLRMGLFRDDDL